jgi:signal transduction histidine kinase
MTNRRGYHILFGTTILGLLALSIWWTVFFSQAVELEKASKLSELSHAAVISALLLGHKGPQPELGPLSGPHPLEIVAFEPNADDPILAPIVPNHPDLAVKPTEQAIATITSKLRARHIMLIGEGSLLLLLLGVCTFMLYRMVRAEQRMIRRMEQFVSAVTHEMKTPLAGIKSMLQTFSDGKVPAHEQERLYSMGLKETDRLEHMIENVLISGRLRTERYRLHIEAVQLHDLLRRFTRHRQRYLIGHPDDLTLDWTLPGDEVEVMGDSNALNLILDNLVDNAFKYGGEAQKVSIRVAVGDNQVVNITVADSGIGFDPAKAEELFIPFERDIGNQVASQHGTGLGLSIARTLARQMEGNLAASSQGQGTGSQFTLSLKEFR